MILEFLPCVMCSCVIMTFKVEREMGIEPTSQAWKAWILPLNYSRKKWAEEDSNPRSDNATDLQSVLVGHLSICPIMGKWSWREASNPRPTDYKSVALPTELRQQICQNFKRGISLPKK